MSIDVHFLERLERLNVAQVDVAMVLYRDTEVLRHVLSHVRLPEGAPRVALSLDHPENGPFVVVTRDGDFVTCLGEGMATKDLPVVTRSQVDAHMSRAVEMRERFLA